MGTDAVDIRPVGVARTVDKLALLILEVVLSSIGDIGARGGAAVRQITHLHRDTGSIAQAGHFAHLLVGAGLVSVSVGGNIGHHIIIENSGIVEVIFQLDIGHRVHRVLAELVKHRSQPIFGHAVTFSGIAVVVENLSHSGGHAARHCIAAAGDGLGSVVVIGGVGGSALSPSLAH